MFIESIYLQSLGWAIINSFWQMALLWIIYQISIFLFKPSPSFKSGFSFIIVLAGFILFLYTLLSFSPQDEVLLSINATLNATYFSLKGFDHHLVQNYLPYIAGIYLIVFLFPLKNMILSALHVHKLKTTQLQKSNPEWRVWVNKMALQMGILKKISIYISDFVQTPVTIGFLKPIILFPVSAITQLDSSQIEALLLHELTHIKRNDYLLNVILTAIGTMLYFNPFINYFLKEIDVEREKNCDKVVLSFNYNPLSYASALLFFEKLRNDHGTIAIAATGTHGLKNRIEAMFGQKKQSGFSIKKTLFGLLVILVFGALNFSNENLEREKTKNVLYTLTDLKFPIYSPGVKGRLNSGSEFAYSNNQETEAKNIQSKKNLNTREFTVRKMNNVNGPVIDFPDVQFASYKIPETVLNEEQLQLVRDAVVATKVILEENGWKNIELNLAEVLTEKEKDLVKEKHRELYDHLEWNLLESKLAQSYDNIDWNMVSVKINEQLSIVNHEKLKDFYQDHITQLDEIICLMNNLKLQTIPDTDISVVQLAARKALMEKQLNRLSEKKQLKIIKL